MEKSGDKIENLPVREVYYLVRGRRKGAQKIALVHGSFFETIQTDDLIRRSFSQVLQESIDNSDLEISEENRIFLSAVFSKQDSFSKVRTVDKASVKLRFRIMTEIKSEGNVLNGNKYPDILDNTVNLIVPLHNETEEERIRRKAGEVFTGKQVSVIKTLKIKHHFNGYFFVFQASV